MNSPIMITHVLFPIPFSGMLFKWFAGAIPHRSKNVHLKFVVGAKFIQRPAILPPGYISVVPIHPMVLDPSPKIISCVVKQEKNINFNL
ncbi:hypothetical protein E3D81_15485 [Sphingobacterium sp. CZ-2]|uniref:Uncharacterized protein n=1 Tax=Sphingobacterium tenebrionis TaxID=3111775 RepID=A0ABU8I2C0_9SPHI|nr:hypothetical protein E3D81_15485 [Sphingobacterium sp. CZ-2]